MKLIANNRPGVVFDRAQVMALRTETGDIDQLMQDLIETREPLLWTLAMSAMYKAWVVDDERREDWQKARKIMNVPQEEYNVFTRRDWDVKTVGNSGVIKSVDRNYFSPSRVHLRGKRKVHRMSIRDDLGWRQYALPWIQDRDWPWLDIPLGVNPTSYKRELKAAQAVHNSYD